MTGETDLEALLAGMDPVLSDGVYVFATAPGADLATFEPREAVCAALMLFAEPEGVTLILPERAALALGLELAFRCRLITLNVHSSLDAIGFLARITAQLASLEMGVNPVSAFHHDHLFVPEARAEEALKALKALAADASAAS
ncbi:MAG: ACT domain-containing protein [Pseudomonadota bacterium]